MSVRSTQNTVQKNTIIKVMRGRKSKKVRGIYEEDEEMICGNEEVSKGKTEQVKRIIYRIQSTSSMQ